MKRQGLHKYTILSRAIFGNSMVMLVGNLLKSIVGFIVSVSLARYLGVSDFGVFSYVFTFIYFFEIVPKLGMDAILVREIAHNRKDAQNLLGNALSLRMLLALLGMLFVCIAITMIKGFSKVSFLVYLSSFGLLFSIQLLYECMFKVDLKMFYPMLANFLKSIVYAILVFSLIYLSSNLYGFVIASILSGFFSLFILIHFSKRYFTINFKKDLKTWKWLWKESLPLLLSGIFTLIYLRINVIILETIKGFKAVGYYSAAYKFLDAILIIPSTAVMSLYPIMSKFFREDLSKFRRICAFGLKYMLMIILPVVIGTIFFADKIISIYGKAFIDASLSLKILVISGFFSFLNIILVNAVIAAGRQKIDAIISGISVPLNIVLNLILIPNLSFNGASLTVVITEVFAFVVLIISLYRISGYSLKDIKIPQLLAANFILLIFFILTRSLPFFMVSIFSVFFYIILMLTFDILRKDMGYLLKEVRPNGCKTV